VISSALLPVNSVLGRSGYTPLLERRISAFRIQPNHFQAHIPKPRRTLSIMNMRRMSWRKHRHISTPQLALLAILQKHTTLPFPLMRYRRPHSRRRALTSILHPSRDKRITSDCIQLRLWRHSVEPRAADASWMGRQTVKAASGVSLLDFERHVDIGCFGLRVSEQRLVLALTIQVEVIEADARLAVA
jgi:hypothetical protein